MSSETMPSPKRVPPSPFVGDGLCEGVTASERSIDEIIVRVRNLSKNYQIYERPRDRLKQSLYPRLQRLIGKPAKQYHREFWALKDVSFEVRRGETFGIIGRNGSGKSTLLQILAGTLAQTSGEVNVNGRVAALLELGSGFNPEFTGRENVFLNGRILGLSQNEIEVRYDQIVEFADIGEFIDQPVKTYSSGMFVRLAFAVITHVDASILIIDEALAVGDAVFVHKCMRFLRRFMERGTLLFVSHDIAIVRALCSQAIWIKKGTIWKIGETKSVLDAYEANVYAEQQDIDNSEKTPSVKNYVIKKPLKLLRDCRLDFLNYSNLRNDIEVFEFKNDADRWGNGLAKITAVWLKDTNENPLSWIIGGEEVVLTIEAEALRDLHDIVLGFQVRDRLGQNLFGDNTFLTTFDSPVSVKAGKSFRAKFRFLMPPLPQGTYAIVTAIATGTQHEHIILDWINESLFIESHNGFSKNGLVGVPMHDIKIEEIGNISE